MLILIVRDAWRKSGSIHLAANASIRNIGNVPYGGDYESDHKNTPVIDKKRVTCRC